MKKKCDCYRTERKLIYGYYPLDEGVCWGTREKDPCSCDDDMTKCNFYPEVRERVKREAKKDKIEIGEDSLIVTYDCCPSDTPTLCVTRKEGNKVKVLNTIQGNAAFGVYEYLKGNVDKIRRKDIPEKVVCDGDDESDDVYCPRCNEYIGLNENVWEEFYDRNWKPMYCLECGQSMIWK